MSPKACVLFEFLKFTVLEMFAETLPTSKAAYLAADLDWNSHSTL